MEEERERERGEGRGRIRRGGREEVEDGGDSGRPGGGGTTEQCKESDVNMVVYNTQNSAGLVLKVIKK